MEISNFPACNKPVRTHCKAVSMSARLEFETRAKREDFVARIKMTVSPMKLTVPSAAPKQLSRFAIPNHLKTGRSESSLRLCGECWPNGSKFSSLKEMIKVRLSSQRSTPAHKFSASRIERNGVGKLVFKLALCGRGLLCTLVALDLCVPGVTPDVFATCSL